MRMQALSINNNEFVFGGKEGKMRNTFHFAKNRFIIFFQTICIQIARSLMIATK